MINKEKNFAFIDSQNLHLGIERLGWKLDYKKFRIYLKEKYGVQKAYMFIGYLPENQNLYKVLQEIGYILIFKSVMKDGEGKAKGNVDANLVLQVMIDIDVYDKAIIITSDGDFYCLVDYLFLNKKLKMVISPNKEKCSILLRKAAKSKIVFLDNLTSKLKYQKTPLKDRT
ncbi:MAG: NYN domain-containing protein [Candidatus Pacebacteria bacterium]|jgi:uncharacterized LabA/DUF88 family protein|nr:NYN domain-containing protein [Candidatus Paceibacterota bacterium]MDD5013258.1 NYN domain-containing protein [Candidatus Paceibacterota bacterium]MDD5752872.1 NYN domain-containing protein [Candidatus Paceibacterota bacterium]